LGHWSGQPSESRSEYSCSRPNQGSCCKQGHRRGVSECGLSDKRHSAGSKSTDRLDSLHDLVGVVAVVGRVGRAIVVVRLAEDEDVVALAERVLEDGDRPKVDVRVVARGLTGRRAVKVPLCTKGREEGVSRGDGGTRRLGATIGRQVTSEARASTRPLTSPGRLGSEKCDDVPLSSETDSTFLSTVW
jgi:hypothetical protein